MVETNVKEKNMDEVKSHMVPFLLREYSYIGTRAKNSWKFPNSASKLLMLMAYFSRKLIDMFDDIMWYNYINSHTACKADLVYQTMM